MNIFKYFKGIKQKEKALAIFRKENCFQVGNLWIRKCSPELYKEKYYPEIHDEFGHVILGYELMNKDSEIPEEIPYSSKILENKLTIAERTQIAEILIASGEIKTADEYLKFMANGESK